MDDADRHRDHVGAGQSPAAASDPCADAGPDAAARAGSQRASNTHSQPDAHPQSDATTDARRRHQHQHQRRSGRFAFFSHQTPGDDSDTWKKTVAGTTTSGMENDGPVETKWKIGTHVIASTPNASWTASQPGTFTLTLEADDKWKGSDKGVTAPDTGTRNDALVSKSVTVKVVSSPNDPPYTGDPGGGGGCSGGWQHHGPPDEWRGGAIEWATGKGMVPVPIIRKLEEHRVWAGDCAPDPSDDWFEVGPDKILDQMRLGQDANGERWFRDVQYSAKALGDDRSKDWKSPVASSPLPFRWKPLESAISGGDPVKPSFTVAPGQTVDIALSEATDRDTRTVIGQGSSVLVDDTPLSYSWSFDGNSEALQGNGTSAQFTAPATPGTYTLTCKIDDQWTATNTGVADNNLDVGTRDDKPKTVTIKVTVPPKDWKPDLGIGKNRVTQPDGSTKDVEDGRILKPQDQTQSPAVPADVAVAAGSGALDVEVESATDLDKWTQVVSGYDGDELSYKWLCDKGSFLKKNGDTWEDVGTEAEGTGAGGTLKWQAPIGEGVETTAKLTCTIDDKPKDVVAPDTGQRGDEALKREVTIRIVPREWKVYQPIGKFKKPDGTLGDDGLMTAPQQQSSGSVKVPRVQPGRQNVMCAVTEATDMDRWTQNLPLPTPTPDPNAPPPVPGASPTPVPSSTPSDEDKDDIVYTWTCTDGYFVVDGQQVQEAKGRQVKWNAPPPPPPTPTPVPDPNASPTPVPTPTPDAQLPHVTISCKIDDKPKEIVLPDGGVRDDGVVTRETTVLIDPNATDDDISHDPGTGGTPVSIKLNSSRNGKENVTTVCAGGWNDAWNDYVYLQKETGQMVRRGDKPDPHIITYTATVTDDAGQVQPGRLVAFTWDMPGPAPEETQTVTTDPEGKASVDVISGDEVSKSYDEDTGELLFDNPVKITATCLGREETQNLDVLAPPIQWQYKDENGDYVAWNGDVWGLYSDPSLKNVPLRALLIFDDMPVVGHSVSWGFDKICDKSEEEVLPEDAEYSTYGYMSGGISTTPINGGATATFMRGYNLGQITFQIEDASIYTWDRSTEDSSSSFSTSAIGTPPPNGYPGEIPLSKRKRKARKSSPPYGEYTLVKGIAAYQNPWGYPANSGEEDNELLQNTLTLVRQQLNPLAPESMNGDRFGQIGVDYSRSWFFAQVVGNDPDSAGYHFADLKITKKGKTRRFGAAFDIVLGHVPVFVPDGRRAQFGPFLKALRDRGIVAWHRWAGEDRDSNGNLASVQNEIHCIDPAYPYIKPQLNNDEEQTGQVYKFIDKGSGGPDYNPEPTDPDDPFTITDEQVREVRKRATTMRGIYKGIYPEAQPLY